MAYLIHFEDESNPGWIKEEIYLTDERPNKKELHDLIPPGFNKATIHNISDEDWPSCLPLDRSLRPHQI